MGRGARRAVRTRGRGARGAAGAPARPGARPHPRLAGRRRERADDREAYGDAPYDDFLDSWRADAFDPASWLALFARAGARYVVPTTKHHDGIALWDAPGTGTRNTVNRGPRRDLIGELASATRNAGLRFGVYYSGGLDWHVTNLPPLDSHGAVHERRPVDAAYAAETKTSSTSMDAPGPVVRIGRPGFIARGSGATGPSTRSTKPRRR